MALIEESIDRIVAGMMELARTIDARLKTATDLDVKPEGSSLSWRRPNGGLHNEILQEAG